MSKRSVTAEWLEPYTALGVEKCADPDCTVGAREEPFYSAYCHSYGHAKRVIRFEMARPQDGDE